MAVEEEHHHPTPPPPTHPCSARERQPNGWLGEGLVRKVGASRRWCCRPRSFVLLHLRGGGGVGALTAKFGGPASGGGSRYGEAAGKFGGGVNGSGGGGRAPPPVPVVKKQPPPLPSRGGGAGLGSVGRDVYGTAIRRTSSETPPAPPRPAAAAPAIPRASPPAVPTAAPPPKPGKPPPKPAKRGSATGGAGDGGRPWLIADPNSAPVVQARKNSAAGVAPILGGMDFPVMEGMMKGMMGGGAEDLPTVTLYDMGFDVSAGIGKWRRGVPQGKEVRGGANITRQRRRATTTC